MNMTDPRGALATSRTKKGSDIQNIQRTPVNDEEVEKPPRKMKTTTITTTTQEDVIQIWETTLQLCDIEREAQTL